MNTVGFENSSLMILSVTWPWNNFIPPGETRSFEKTLQK